MNERALDGQTPNKRMPNKKTTNKRTPDKRTLKQEDNGRLV